MDMKIVRDDGKEPPSLLLAWSDDLKTNSMLELMPIKHPGPSPRDLPRLCPGLRHFAIRVTDFDQAYARVKAAGVEFLFEPTTAVGGGRVVSFRDPDGNEVQIVQR
jgi:catechol 2,3-dioxygenase-like lactoylglutathione lyase family enzyme